jgi:hypothetical protein
VPASTYPPEIKEAIQLHREGKQQESRDCLRDFLTQQPANIDALLWLAKVSPDPDEAVTAAELALKLDPAKFMRVSVSGVNSALVITSHSQKR